MKRRLCAIFIAGWLLLGPAASLPAAKEEDPEEKPTEEAGINREDLEVIRHMELLQLMVLLQDMELLEDAPKVVTEDQQ